MTEAYDYSATPTAASPLADRSTPNVSSTDELLTQGGDARIALDPATARNRYGCAAAPEPGLADFGSSTASGVSASGVASPMRANSIASAPS
jgi:hypothetical protein